MNIRHQFGKTGEEKAADFLKAHAYVILERNWRVGHKEIDIICTDGKFLIIVEVKTRKNEDENPAELMDYKKRKNILRAGEAYMKQRNIDKELRFDLIIVCGQEYRITHIKEAIQIFG